MIQERSRSFAPFLTKLLGAGRVVFSGEEAEQTLGIRRGAFLDAAERLQRRGQILRPRRDFYIVVPPQYQNLGSPPPSWFIDDLMRKEGHSYYVGLLKAAELHGAAHQAAQEFQVITDKRIPVLKAGRSRLAFYYRSDMAAVQFATQKQKTESGYMNISSAELTILDLIRYPQASGGLDNVFTIIDALAVQLDAAKLAALATVFERSVVQRTGYLLDHGGLKPQADALHETLWRGALPQWVELDPSLASDKDLAPSVIERNERWRLIIRRIPERDE
jgi:predicted transcriptional regulator of viral defense system